MGLKSIVEKLGDLLDPKKAKKKKRAKEIRKLLAKLEKKREKIERKLAHAKTDKERKKLERKLKISIAQMEKGKKVLQADADSNAGATTEAPDDKTEAAEAGTGATPANDVEPAASNAS